MDFMSSVRYPLPVIYDDIKIDGGYRIDILVETGLSWEIKSVESLNDLYTAQVLTYLKLGGYRLGLLLNFNTPQLKQGIKRLIMGYDE